MIKSTTYSYSHCFLQNLLPQECVRRQESTALPLLPMDSTQALTANLQLTSGRLTAAAAQLLFLLGERQQYTTETKHFQKSQMRSMFLQTYKWAKNAGDKTFLVARIN